MGTHLAPASGAALSRACRTFVLHRGIAHMLEVKADDGVLSDAQRAVAAALLAARGHVGVARDAEEALACLDAWGISRARRMAVRQGSFHSVW